MIDVAETLLQPAINVGLDEGQFWDMTVAEIQRYIDGALWRYKQQAINDYTLANLIGVSVGRLFDDKAEMPDIIEVYPNLFEAEEKAKREEMDRIKKSQNNFMAFAMKLNAMKDKELNIEK